MQTKFKLTTRPHVFLPNTHTHRAIYNSPGPFFYPLTPSCQTLNSTTAQQIGSAPVPTNPIFKTPGLLWLAPSAACALCQLLFDCQTKISEWTLQAAEWDAEPEQEGWWLLWCPQEMTSSNKNL